MACVSDTCRYISGAGVWSCQGCAPTPTKTPIPTATRTPTLTPIATRTPTATRIPTATPTLYSNCVGLTANKALNTLKVGDAVTFTVTFNGTPQDVGIIIKKDGEIVLAKTANGSYTSLTTWNYTYIIASDGNYEVNSFVKFGGVWK
jgi:hypothetical protein